MNATTNAHLFQKEIGWKRQISVKVQVATVERPNSRIVITA